jgi:hypothetical protein
MTVKSSGATVESTRSAVNGRTTPVAGRAATLTAPARRDPNRRESEHANQHQCEGYPVLHVLETCSEPLGILAL